MIRISGSLTDIAGNSFAPASATVSGVQTSISVMPLLPGDVPDSAPRAYAGSVEVPVTSVPLSGKVRTATFEGAAGPSVLAVDLSSMTDLSSQQSFELCVQDDRGLSAECTERTAQAGPLAVNLADTIVERLEFAAGTHVAGLPAGEQLRVSDAATARAGIALSGFERSDEALGYDVQYARAVELGSPEDNVLFSEPVRAVFDPLALYRGTLVCSRRRRARAHGTRVPRRL